MGKCRFMWTNLWDTGTLTASSENSNFPASNTRHRWHERPYRSIACAAEWLQTDLGSPKQISIVIIKKNNFTAAATIKLQGDPPAYEITFPFISQNIMVLFLPTVQTRQVWRITMVDAVNPDIYLAVGRPFLGQYFEPEKNFARERDHAPTDPSLLSESEGGQESSIVRTQYNLKNYNFLHTRQKANFDSIFASRGLKKDFFFCEDSDNPQSSTYYCRFANFKWMHAYFERWHLAMTLKELL